MATQPAFHYPHISRDPHARRGSPCIAGTPVRVSDVASAHTAGMPEEQLRHHFPSRPLTLSEIHAALAYYYDHRDEVDALPADGDEDGPDATGDAERGAALDKALIKARSLLALRDDWDGEGARGYAEATWERVAAFLRDQDRQAREQLDLELPVPRILPGPDGSIDVLWHRGDFELLVNFPADASRPATLYGDDHGQATIRGTFDAVAPRLNLVPWLVSR